MLARFLATLLLSAALATPGTAASPLLLVTNYEPPRVMEKAAENPGFVTEIVQAAFNAADIDLVIQYYPWRRCANLVQDGKAFGAFPYTRTEERDEFAYFSASITIGKSVFFYRENSGNPGNLTKLEDYRGYSIAGIRGYHYERLFRTHGLNIEYTSSERAALRMLAAERVDYVAMGEQVGKYYADRLSLKEGEKICSTPGSWRVAPVHLMVSKKYPESGRLLDRFNEGLAAIKSNGVYEEILAKYGITSRH